VVAGAVAEVVAGTGEVDAGVALVGVDTVAGVDAAVEVVTVTCVTGVAVGLMFPAGEDTDADASVAVGAGAYVT
jgi:hypothetical protein